MRTFDFSYVIKVDGKFMAHWGQKHATCNKACRSMVLDEIDARLERSGIDARHGKLEVFQVVVSEAAL